MATFRFIARKQNGAKEKGQLEATDKQEALKLLHARDLIPLELTENRDRPGSIKLTIFRRKKVRLQEKIIFTRQLSMMIKAGLSIVKALEALKKQSGNQYFQEVIAGLIEKIEGGQPLSQALSRYHKVFSEIEIAVIKAGEQTGKLSEVLLTLAIQQEKDASLIGKIKGAMIYPAVILTALIGVVVLVIFMVLPNLEQVFADVGGELPLQTKLLLSSSSAIRHYAWLIVLLAAGLYVASRYYCRTPRGRLIYDNLKLHLPVFGDLTKKVYMARFSRTMALLIQSSLPILQSIEIIKKTISNVLYEQAFDRIEQLVRTGQPFSVAVDKEKVFPPMVSQLTSLGEQSGELDSVLLEVAEFYDKEVDQITKNLTTLIEPFLLILMGVGVAFIATAILGPIYSLASKF